MIDNQIETPGQTTLENGLTVVQENSFYAADLRTDSKFYGWLFTKGPDGQFITIRKLESWELAQAEDQEFYGIIINGYNNSEMEN